MKHNVAKLIYKVGLKGEQFQGSGSHYNPRRGFYIYIVYGPEP